MAINVVIATFVTRLVGVPRSSVTNHESWNREIPARLVTLYGRCLTDIEVWADGLAGGRAGCLLLQRHHVMRKRAGNTCDGGMRPSSRKSLREVLQSTAHALVHTVIKYWRATATGNTITQLL